MDGKIHLNAMEFDHPALRPARNKVQQAYALLADCFAAGGKLLLCGNGGSACDCEHIAGELMKSFRLKRSLLMEEKAALEAQGAEGALLSETLQRGLPVIVLTALTGLATAFANDVDASMVYAQQAFVYCRPGDVLLAISTSGNARNVYLAAVAARARDAKVLALTGRGGGKLAGVCDLLLDVPETETYRVQEQHLAVYHCLCLMLETHFFGEEEQTMHDLSASAAPVEAVVFDFDGTLSSLRHGWETVMEPMMLELISGGDVTDDIRAEVRRYIDESTGIQTIHQMKWLAEAVRRRGKTEPMDPWAYKAEYNRRLMLPVGERLSAVASGQSSREEYTIAGSRELLNALKLRGVKLYAASGTDHPDVVREAKALGLSSYFDEVHGAPEGAEDCSKEAVLKQLVEGAGLTGERVAVIGDGKVEIALAKAIGARALGVASDEEARRGVNPQKVKRLEAAGADLIVGDFTDLRKVLDFLGLSRNPALGFKDIRTASAKTRENLVTIQNLLTPGVSPVPEWGDEAFDALIGRILAARQNNRPVILSMGAHVIKNRLSRYLIGLMREGFVTHLAGNGACSIHDFELCYLGGTSEDVPTAIEDGSFGMWEETGRWMNEAILDGYLDGYGYGEALARYIDRHPDRFPYRDDCVLYQAWRLGVPATYHIALGTDIIHQHPIADFQAIGGASGIDFHTMCKSVSMLDGGVFLNFGSGVIGPEVFLKALSISRNLGYPTYNITTANFDLVDLGDYRKKVGYDDPHYYYRPRKNIVLRPVSRGGMGWHFVGDHLQTIPNLYQKLAAKGGRA